MSRITKSTTWHHRILSAAGVVQTRERKPTLFVTAVSPHGHTSPTPMGVYNEEVTGDWSAMGKSALIGLELCPQVNVEIKI